MAGAAVDALEVLGANQFKGEGEDPSSARTAMASGHAYRCTGLAGELALIREGHEGHAACAELLDTEGHGQRATGVQGHVVDASGLPWTRPERANGVSNLPGMSFCAANHAQPVVLRLVITGVQLVCQNRHCGALWLKQMSDAANFGQRQSSHVGDWGGVSLSSGMYVQRTTTLDSLGSNKLMYRVHPLQMSSCGSRCLYWFLASTYLN